MKIVVVDNFDSFVYNIIRYLRESGNQIFVMRINSLDFGVLQEADAIVLSPGPGIPTENKGLMEVIEKFHDSKPILGICLGHQALAEFFGNDLQKSEFPIHGQASEIQIKMRKDIFVGFPAKVLVGRYHSWLVKSPISAPLICTSMTESGEIMSFKHADLPIFGLQFHPESILTPEGRMMLNNWLLTL